MDWVGRTRKVPHLGDPRLLGCGTVTTQESFPDIDDVFRDTSSSLALSPRRPLTITATQRRLLSWLSRSLKCRAL